MQALPKEYSFLEVERRWQQKWADMGIFQYDWNDTERFPFSVDTPPPYPSGESFSDVVLRVASHERKKSILEFVGTWKGDDIDEVFSQVLKDRELS